MKKLVSLLLASVLLASGALLFASCGDDIDVEFVETPYAGTTLYVYNWGEYISDGREGSLDVIRYFEKKYDIEVKYSTYQTNEEMYAQLSTGARYDVVIPSDYMIERLVREGLVQKLDFDNIPNYEYIADRYKDLYFDPDNEYSVPYTAGMVGIIYNTTKVDEADIADQSWSLLWNTDYDRNQLINMNNSRDAFGTAMYYLGLDVNSTNRADWDAAFNKLKEQNCIYLMDEIYNKMENNTASAAAYYAGDALSMVQENPDLAFYYPVEGTNSFVDSMCVPTTARNKGAAELFINFMLDPYIGAMNANYICYASPNTEVWNHPDYDYREGTAEYDILYSLPESYTADPDRMQYFHILDDATQAYMDELWLQLFQ